MEPKPGPEAPEYDFGVGRVRTIRYADGTAVRGLRVPVLRDGVEIGEVDVHLHRNGLGANGISYGITIVPYPEGVGEPVEAGTTPEGAG